MNLFVIKKTMAKLLSIMFAILLTACFSISRKSESSRTNETSLITTEITESHESVNLLDLETMGWKEAYKALLLNYSVTPHRLEWVERRFFLYDINRDGVPELFIIYNAAGTNCEAVYTFSNGEVRELEGDFRGYHGFFTPLNKQPGIINLNYGDIMLLMVDDEYNLFTEIHLHNPFFKGVEFSGDGDYIINGKKVTEEEYNRVFDSIFSNDTDVRFSLRLRSFEITDVNINEIIFGW
jgi:hypothetical protein